MYLSVDTWQLRTTEMACEFDVFVDLQDCVWTEGCHKSTDISLTVPQYSSAPCKPYCQLCITTCVLEAIVCTVVQSCIHEEIKGILDWEDSWYHPVQNVCFLRTQNLKYTNLYFAVLYIGVKFFLSQWGKTVLVLESILEYDVVIKLCTWGGRSDRSLEKIV
jgi:hypothetical protein